VRNILDNAHYAIKCIDSSRFERTEYVKLLREVKSHAQLSHINIVRYFSSWLEHQSIDMTFGSIQSLEYDNESLESSSDSETNDTPHFVNSIFLFIQMEMCQYTLESWIRARNDHFTIHPCYDSIRTDEALVIFSHLLTGLKYIHKKRFIHRDIKPQNVYWKAHDNEMVDVDDIAILETIHSTKGEWKIGDFGLVYLFNGRLIQDCQ